MKKILCLLLCFAMATLFLVSCGDDDLGSEFLDIYPENNTVVEDVKLNMYIITDSQTADNAKITVNSMIATHTLAKYHSEVNVCFVDAENYEDVILDAAKSEDANAANIVLVNSYDLMEKLMAHNVLADLTDYLNSTDFGTLNVSVEKLLKASKLTIDGEEKYFAIPNNHAIGEYEFLVIDEEIAKQTLKYNASTLSSYTTYEDTLALRNDISTKLGLDPDEYVQRISGMYSLKEQFEAAGKVCNVIKYPVADAEEAFSSAFAIIDRGAKLNLRSMEIIYALTSNTDTQLRNYLQYGVIGTNYTHSSDGKVIRVDNDDNRYYMDIKYTGDMFYAENCDELNWNDEAKANAKLQNAEAVVEYIAAE